MHCGRIRTWSSLKHADDSIRSTGDFQQVIPELSLHRTMHLIQFAAEYDLVKLRHHLARAEFAQRSAVFAGRALRMFFRHVSEFRPVRNLLLEGRTLSFIGNQNVSSACASHGSVLSVKKNKADGKVSQRVETDARSAENGGRHCDCQIPLEYEQRSENARKAKGDPRGLSSGCAMHMTPHTVASF